MVWTPTPAPRALSALQLEVGNFIQAPSDTTLASVITDALNDGIRKLHTKARWPWALTSENVTLVAGTADYELATTAAKKVRKIKLLDAATNEVGEIRYLLPKEFDEVYADRSQNSDVWHYTVRNMSADGKISLSAPPSASFVQQYPKLKVFILKRLIYYSAAGDTLTTLGGAPPEVEDFLVWHAKAYMASINRPDLYPIASGREQDIWTGLVRDGAEEVDWD